MIRPRIFLLVLIFCAAPLLGFSANVKIGWDANTESDLAGYRLYQGTTSGTYDAVVAEIPAGTQSVTISVGNGTYFWALTAYDTDGNESGYSNEVTLTINSPAIDGLLMSRQDGAGN